MRARGWVAALLALATTAAADPKPAPVDVKAYKDKLQVFQDAKGGVYAVSNDRDNRHVFYGTGKQLFEQILPGPASSDGSTGAWDIALFAPRLAELRFGSIGRRADGIYMKTCDGKDDAILTELSPDKAKAVIDKSQFLSTGTIRVAHLLFRDDHGIYYYVDRLSRAYGSKGFRVFVGKKGAMKEMPLTDVANDSAGQVYATKTGDLRLIKDKGTQAAEWVKGEKRQALVQLDIDVDSPLIYSELGIYSYLGTVCDNVSS
jgi:hypothetical protein